MNKKLLVSFALASLTGISTQAKEKMSSETTQQRPNIILFMVDDMGWQDTSLPFWTQKTHYNETYETPNMERLAKKGMMFTQAYACNISSATRCSLITGANNTRHRVTNWTLEKNKATDRPSNTIQLPDWNYNGVSQVTGTSNTFVGTSFVELLRQNGYHTIHCGKAHFGSIDTPGENPTHWGFEVNIAGHAAGGLATYLSEQNYGHTRDGKPYSLMAIPGLEDYWGTGIFATEALTREAIKALDKAKKYNQPFYQGGIREPMIVSWPGVVTPNTRCDKYLIIEDFYPTILEMAGITNYKTVNPIDGISFMPLLKGTGDPSKGRALVWNFPNIWGNDGPGINLDCSIRKDEWKLIYYYETGKKELFNIPNDISEKNDVAKQHPGIVKRLSKELGNYLRATGGQRPTFKATGKPCPWPDEI